MRFANKEPGSNGPADGKAEDGALKGGATFTNGWTGARFRVPARDKAAPDDPFAACEVLLLRNRTFRS